MEKHLKWIQSMNGYPLFKSFGDIDSQCPTTAKWLPKDKCQAAEVPDHATSVHTTEYEIEENSAKARDAVSYISCSNLNISINTNEHTIEGIVEKVNDRDDSQAEVEEGATDTEVQLQHGEDTLLPIAGPVSLTGAENYQADMLGSSVAQITITGRENQRSTNESSVPPVPRPTAVPNPE